MHNGKRANLINDRGTVLFTSASVPANMFNLILSITATIFCDILFVENEKSDFPTFPEANKLALKDH